MCFSKKLRNLEAAFAMPAADYNYVWRARRPGSTSKLRPTSAIVAGLTDHLWNVEKFFGAVLG